MNGASEQLWYTWTNYGIGGNHGFQIRAVSQGFRDERGRVNVNSEEMEAQKKHFQYIQPQGDDNGSLSPDNAPINLTFVKAGSKEILVQKRYTGSDKVKREGAFFTHLLTDLPQITIYNTLYPFSAREAIETWGSLFWRNSENSLTEETTTLPQVIFDQTFNSNNTSNLPIEKVSKGSISEVYLRQLIKNPQHLQLALQAFLTLAQNPQQHIYIVAPSDYIACIIWGLTHSLPRTASIMKNFSFSTFEGKIEVESGFATYRKQQLPTLIGTYWFNTKKDLPEILYQENNYHGFALNCITNRMTPLKIEPSIQRYASFAADCLLGLNGYTISDLEAIVTETEQKQAATWNDIFSIYLVNQQPLTKQETTQLLNTIAKRLTRISNGEQIYDINIDLLIKSNVQNSILKWIQEDPQWWAEVCQPHLQQFAFASNLPANIYSILYQFLRDLGKKIAESIYESIKKDNIEEIKRWTDVLLEVTTSRPQLIDTWYTFIDKLTTNETMSQPHADWLGYKGCQVLIRLRKNIFTPSSQGSTPLTEYAKNISGIITKTIALDQWNGAKRWQDLLNEFASAEDEPIVWGYMLQKLVTIACTSSYQKWWETYGKSAWIKLNTQKDQHENPELTSSFDSFQQHIATQLIHSISTESQQQPSFWEDVSMVIMPVKTEAQAWINLFINLWSNPYQPTYQIWWERKGKSIIQDLHSVAYDEQNTKKQMYKLGMCIANQIHQVFQTIVQNQQQTAEQYHNIVYFWNDVFKTTVNPQQNEQALKVWLYLHREMLVHLVYTSTYIDWWKLNGRETARQLRHFEEKYPRRKIMEDLPIFIQMTINELVNKLNELIKTQYTHVPVEQQDLQVIDTLLNILTTIVPTEMLSLVWQSESTDLLGKLTDTAQFYSWETKRSLLRTWKDLPQLPDITPWLPQAWPEILQFLIIQDHPQTWRINAVKQLFSSQSPSDEEVQGLFRLIEQNQQVVESALKQAMQDSQLIENAIDFYTYLASHHYAQSTGILGVLIESAALYQPQQLPFLMKLAEQYQENEKLILENYCLELIEKFPLPNEILPLIENYCIQLNIEHLLDPQNKANEFIHLLERRNRIPELKLSDNINNHLTFWILIAELFKHSVDCKSWLEKINTEKRALTFPSMKASNRRKLEKEMRNRVVEYIESEVDLIRFLDTFGRFFRGEQSKEKTLSPGLLLLQEMASLANERVTRERKQWELLLPYLHVALEQAHTIKIPVHKEDFLDPFLSKLFKGLDQPTLDQVAKVIHFWPKPLQDEWKAVEKRKNEEQEQAREAQIRKHIDHLRQALQSREITTIAKAYQHAKELDNPTRYLKDGEALCARLAYNLYIACNPKNGIINYKYIYNAYMEISALHGKFYCSETMVQQINIAKVKEEQELSQKHKTVPDKETNKKNSSARTSSTQIQNSLQPDNDQQVVEQNKGQNILLSQLKNMLKHKK